LVDSVESMMMHGLANLKLILSVWSKQTKLDFSCMSITHVSPMITK